MSWKECYKFSVQLVGTIFVWGILFVCLFGGKIAIESEGILILIAKWTLNLL